MSREHWYWIAALGAAIAGVWMILRRKIQIKLSPNCSTHTGIWRGVAIHYTAGGAVGGTVKWFQNPDSNVSAHFVIGRHGEIVQCVKMSKAAWHTGTTYSTETNNQSLVGIELCNRGLLEESGGRLYYRVGNDRYSFDGAAKQGRLTYSDGTSRLGWWETYPTLQLGALVWLLGELRVKHDVPMLLYGHEDICKPAGRKSDPGPLFPWHLMPGVRKYPKTTSEVLP